jgi:stage II sporulation protein D
VRRSPYIRVLAAWAAFFLAIAPIATPEARADITPAAIPDFTITGAGNGHGIGLSQYGAQGFALKGWKYDAIIGHYYKGTAVAAQANTVSPRINLDRYGDSRATWTLRAVDATLTVYDSIKSVKLPKNTFYTFSHTASGVVVKLSSSGATVATFTQASVKADPEGNALTEVRDNSGPNLNPDFPNGYGYMRWRGYIEFVCSDPSSLYMYNVVGFQEYLYGVVPRESPASWNAEALKAQAVVARSYAKRKVDPDDNGVRPDVRGPLPSRPGRCRATRGQPDKRGGGRHQGQDRQVRFHDRADVLLLGVGRTDGEHRGLVELLVTTAVLHRGRRPVRIARRFAV